MGLGAISETAKLFRKKNISLTERDKDFVMQFAFRTSDMELTEKLMDELADAGPHRDLVCRKYRTLSGPVPDWVQRIENLLISLETYRIQEEQAVKTLAEFLSACGISISEAEIRRTDTAKMQERIRREQMKKEASL